MRLPLPLTLGRAYAGGTAEHVLGEQTAEHTSEADVPLIVRGVAYVFDRPMHLGRWLTVLVRPGAFTVSLNAPTAGSERDILLLRSHNMDTVLARTSRNTLAFSEGPDALRYEATLDPSDPDAAAAAAKVRAGNLVHSSVGFRIAKGDWDDVKDTCGDPQCTKAGLAIEMLIATEIQLYELSLVAQGACIGTTVTPAGRHPSGTSKVSAERVEHVLQSAKRRGLFERSWK